MGGDEVIVLIPSPLFPLTVYPVFANLAFTNDISPMLMFDYGAPQEFPINKKKPRGVGDLTCRKMGEKRRLQINCKIAINQKL
jgi:hypothetical protein